MDLTAAKYDYAIIGSGIAGMICAAYLSRKGARVLLIEKNHQLGGALQVFSREKKIFDTGVHYIGSMAPGKPLHTLFSFLGIGQMLHFAPLDEHGFDRIYLQDTGQIYPLSQGWDAFIQDLAFHFPTEEAGLHALKEKILHTTALFRPFYLLRPAEFIPPTFFSEPLAEVLDKLFINTEIKKVITGNSILYGYDMVKTPFYVFALIIQSYIEGAYRMIRGGSQIARELSKVIHRHGGRTLKHAEVASIITADKKVTRLTLADGREIHADFFISNLHPERTVKLLDPDILRPGYSRRISELTNSPSFVSVQFSLKPDRVNYFNHNIYFVAEGVTPGRIDHRLSEAWPEHFLICTGREAIDQTHAATLTVLAHADYNDFAAWEKSFNTILSPGNRGMDYETLKDRIVQKVLSRLDVIMPEVRAAVSAVFCSTPLTIRDFLNAPAGTAYGVEKNAADILRCMIPPYTRIRNLYLTGQSTDIHGIYGTSVSALLTLSHLREGENIWEEIDQFRSTYSEEIN